MSGSRKGFPREKIDGDFEECFQAGIVRARSLIGVFFLRGRLPPPKVVLGEILMLSKDTADA